MSRINLRDANKRNRDRQIILTEQDDGSMLMETKNYTGDTCLEEAAKVAAMLGETVEGSIELKPEHDIKPQVPGVRGRSGSVGGTRSGMRG